jgi:rhodanese-related sulfurtransferase
MAADQSEQHAAPAVETELPAEQVANGAPANAQLVDVRTDEEVAASRIPDSRHIPVERLEQEAETLDRGRPVVFYCRGGERSSAAADAFRNSGWDAYSIIGGLTSWADQGLPLEPEGAAVGTRSQLPPR